MKKTFYKTPTLKVVEFKVENGFAASGLKSHFDLSDPFTSGEYILDFFDEQSLEQIDGGNDYNDWN